MVTPIDNEIIELDPEEWAQMVDERARKLLGLSGEEFERRLNSGEIDIDGSPEITRVAMMLPFSMPATSRTLPRQVNVTASVLGYGPLGKSPGKSLHPYARDKTTNLQALRHAGGGTRTPDTRIMIPLL